MLQVLLISQQDLDYLVPIVLLHLLPPQLDIIECVLIGEVKNIDGSECVFEVGRNEVWIIELSDDIPETDCKSLHLLLERSVEATC